MLSSRHQAWKRHPDRNGRRQAAWLWLSRDGYTCFCRVREDFVPGLYRARISWHSRIRLPRIWEDRGVHWKEWGIFHWHHNLADAWNLTVGTERQLTRRWTCSSTMYLLGITRYYEWHTAQGQWSSGLRRARWTLLVTRWKIWSNLQAVTTPSNCEISGHTTMRNGMAWWLQC